MKRAAAKLQNFNSVDVEMNAKVQHQKLLNEYLELQKDFVSKKRKLEAAKQKRETILAVVKFLRRKRELLLNSHTNSTTEAVGRRRAVRERSMNKKERH